MLNRTVASTGQTGPQGTYHKLTKLMNMGENCLSSELLSCGGSPFTTCVSWSKTLFHLGYGNFPVANSYWKQAQQKEIFVFFCSNTKCGGGGNEEFVTLALKYILPGWFPSSTHLSARHSLVWKHWGLSSQAEENTTKKLTQVSRSSVLQPSGRFVNCQSQGSPIDLLYKSHAWLCFRIQTILL